LRTFVYLESLQIIVGIKHEQIVVELPG